MIRSLFLTALLAGLSACGVAETGAAAAADATAKAQEAHQGLATEQRVRQQLDIAAQQAAEQRQAANAGSQ
jgi:hypothetical protein